MAADSGILVVDRDAQLRLANYIKYASLIQDEGWQQRGRFEDIDRAYMREGDFTEEQRKAQLANKRGDVTKLQNMQVPMVMEAVENSASFLTQVFGSEYPMFQFLADPDKEDIALQWNTLVGEDQVNFGWAGQFNIAYRNGAKYNFAPVEIDWCKKIKYKPVNGNSGGVSLQQVVYEGNKIYAPDPYNTIYDSRVPIHKVHEEGEFAGYIRHMTRIGLKIFLAGLGEERLRNDKEAFQSPNWDVSYYTPYLNPDVILRSKNWSDGAFNWVNWVTDKAQAHITYQNMYTVVILYARIMPFEFGIKAPKDQTPDVWKLICVNGVMVYAQPMVNAHDLLPLVIVQPLVDNLDHQTKALAENTLPFQQMTSALWNAKLQSARRRTTDRMIYNPLLIDPDHINSPNPTAKIPIKPTAYGRKLDEAVYVIPFDDANSQYFLQEADGVAKWGLRANGQNNVSVGQFQKGNKLESEFNQTMANAGARDRTAALMWENFGMTPIKIQLKSNYLQFTPKGVRYNREQETVVNIDPVQLRETEAAFQISDGLTNAQKLVHADVMSEGFQVMASVPAIGNSFELGPLYSYMMKIRGADRISKFEKSPEKIQYEQALNAWQNAAAGIVKANPEMKPEDIQKILGPMPQPPQPKQAPTK